MRKDPLEDLKPGGLFKTVDFTRSLRSLDRLNQEVIDLEDALIEARDREQKLAPLNDISEDSLRDRFPSLKTTR